MVENSKDGEEAGGREDKNEKEKRGAMQEMKRKGVKRNI